MTPPFVSAPVARSVEDKPIEYVSSRALAANESSTFAGPRPSAAGLSASAAGPDVAAPVNAARPSVGSLSGDADAKRAAAVAHAIAIAGQLRIRANLSERAPD